MPEFKTKEEYEKWKAERIKKANTPAAEKSEIKPQIKPKREKPTEKKCKYCAMMIPYDARICPHCRKKQPSTIKTVIAVGVILILLGPCIAVMFNLEKNSSTKTQVKKEYPTEIDACVVSTHIVQDYLKAPSTAKFPWTCAAVKLQTGAWHVRSYVDSQNSFGAMLRTNYMWTAEFNKNKNEWNIIYFKLGDEEIIKN
jgi:hypothetical protein